MSCFRNVTSATTYLAASVNTTNNVPFKYEGYVNLWQRSKCTKKGFVIVHITGTMDTTERKVQSHGIIVQMKESKV